MNDPTPATITISRKISFASLAPTRALALAQGGLHVLASRGRKYISSTLLLVDDMGYDPMNREKPACFSVLSATAMAAAP